MTDHNTRQLMRALAEIDDLRDKIDRLIPCRWRCEKCQIDVVLEDIRTPVTMMNHSCGGRLIVTQWAEPVLDRTD